MKVQIIPSGNLPRFFCILTSMLITIGVGFAQVADDRILNTIQAQSRSFIDWETKKLHIILSAPVDGSEVRNRSTLISRKEVELKNLFAPLFPLFIQPIRLDSTRSYINLMQADPDLTQKIRELQTQSFLLSSQPSADLKSLSLEYLFPLFPHLSSPLIDFQQPIELDRILEWHPKADYTGVVIHAEGALPWFGSDRDAKLAMALFPRLLDEDSRVILDASRMLPIAARRWGTAAYVTGPHPERLTERVGDNPLITTARAIYGSTPTDIMISKADADLLLYHESTRRALREGKVLIVVDRSNLIEDTSR